jgi:hypothetical protein
MKLDKDLALKALKMLDEAIFKKGLPFVRMTAGGGASMLLAYGFPGKTSDVDAVPSNGADFNEIKILAEEVAKKLGIEHDWLNPYFQTFTIYLPADAKDRMKLIYSGKHLVVESLGPEDVLIMKLMAGRSKDRAHIKHLIKKVGVHISIVENRLQELKDQGLYKKLAENALDLLDEEIEE